MIQQSSRRVIRTLGRLGYLETGMEPPGATGDDPLRDHEPALARTMAASVQQRIAGGERAGQPVRRIGAGFGHEGEAPRLTGPRCASMHGLSLHANTQIPAHRRDQLQHLIRYMARGAVVLERLTQDTHGELVYTFTHPWSDGTTGIRLSLWELLEKLAASVPLPHVHLVRYGECLAPHSHLRHAIMPTPRQQGTDGMEGTAEIVTVPDALEPLVDYYRRLAGEHPDWDDYRRATMADRHALIRARGHPGCTGTLAGACATHCRGRAVRDPRPSPDSQPTVAPAACRPAMYPWQMARARPCRLNPPADSPPQ